MTTNTAPDGRRVSWDIIGGIGVIGASILAFSSFALYGLAVFAGVPEAFAWVLPLSLDGAVLVSTRITLDKRMPDTKSHPVRRWAQWVAFGCFGTSVAGNAIAHIVIPLPNGHELVPTGDVARAVIAVLCGAVPIVVLGVIVHIAGMIVAWSSEQAAKDDEKRVRAAERAAAKDVPTKAPSVPTKAAAASAATVPAPVTDTVPETDTERTQPWLRAVPVIDDGLEELNRDELRDAADRYGVTKRGSKADILARIRGTQMYAAERDGTPVPEQGVPGDQGRSEIVEDRDGDAPAQRDERAEEDVPAREAVTV